MMCMVYLQADDATKDALYTPDEAKKDVPV